VSATAFWQEHQVGGPYQTLEESAAALDERQALYPNLYELMPVNFPGKTVLDYGCGPGHDTLLFLLNGASHVYFTDISLFALSETAKRLYFHELSLNATNVPISKLPRVDHVHCAGVLHHMLDPVSALKRMHRALKRDGTCNVMVYDGDRSKRTQSDVPITHWWGRAEFMSMAMDAGFVGSYLGSYECSAPWRPDCYAACYELC